MPCFRSFGLHNENDYNFKNNKIIILGMAGAIKYCENNVLINEQRKLIYWFHLKPIRNSD